MLCTSGGVADKVAEAAKLMSEKKLDVSKVILHVMGLNDAAVTTKYQPVMCGGKKCESSGKK